MQNVKILRREIMKFRNTLAIILLTLLSTLSGCYGIPMGTTEESTVGQLQLKATNAGIVKANTQKTTYKIRCSVCGFQNEDKTIITPTVKDTYVKDWLCPNCGHRQIIMIQAFERPSSK
jgi:predicted RNA-binding Zn-ribbon protein involved in translation (DUF1610 family)